MKTVHLSTLTDRNFLIPTMVMMTSAKDNMAEGSRYHFHLFHSNLSEWEIATFKKLDSPTFRVDVIKLDKELNRFTHLPDKNRFGQAALMRLNLPNLLTDLDRVLYLDGDIMVHQDLTDFFSIDLQNNLIAAVKATLPLYNPNFINNFPGKTYINSGVLIMNLKLMRQENIVDRFISNAVKVQKFWLCPDQDLINYTCAGRIKVLPPKYNGMNALYHKYFRLDPKRFNDYYQTSYESYAEMEHEYILTHWAGPVEMRPWERSNNTSSEAWIYYFLKSPIRHMDLNLETPWKRLEKLEASERIRNTTPHHPPVVSPRFQTITYGFSRFLPVITVKSSFFPETGCIRKRFKLFGFIPLMSARGYNYKMNWRLFNLIPIWRSHKVDSQSSGK